jgi:hypothetical protein
MLVLAIFCGLSWSLLIAILILGVIAAAVFAILWIWDVVGWADQATIASIVLTLIVLVSSAALLGALC